MLWVARQILILWTWFDREGWKPGKGRKDPCDGRQSWQEGRRAGEEEPPARGNCSRKPYSVYGTWKGRLIAAHAGLSGALASWR